MRRTKPVAAPMVARVYLRVSTDAQDLERQEAITTAAKAAGYYVAGIYREKASGARADRPELLRMIGDLQPGEVVIAEKIDRISRLPLPEAERRFNCTSKVRKLKEIYAHAQKQTRAQHQYCKKRRKSVHAAFYAA